MKSSETVLRGYISRFTSLHRNRHPRHGAAPHKPILLLALLDGIERGIIHENRVVLTAELVALFRAYWRILVPENTWQERIIYPFRYLASEGFWELLRDGLPIADSDLGHPTSIGQLTSRVDFGKFAPDLWLLVSQDAVARATLRVALLSAYFPNQTNASAQQVAAPADPLFQEAERLIIEATQARFRSTPRPRSERESDASYLRHHLFPRVVTALYKNTCCICRLSVWSDIGDTVVDAAHIMPFSRFHNDDPRNGIAFCKNHHWGFDRGWFTVTEEYRVRRSSRLNGECDLYVADDRLLTLPADSRYAPASEALAWHTQNVFRP